MTEADFSFLVCFLRERSGISLSKDKAYLVESRLMPLVRAHSFGDLSHLIGCLRSGTNQALATAVIEAMTTNETFFFRDKTPFERFKDTMLPALLEARRNVKRLRIWCAAASTGQEPYSLAMLLLDEAARLSGWAVDIIATDLSSEVIDRAGKGIYTQFEVQRGLPIQLLVKHFQQQGDKWQISPSIRRMVQFRSQNLLRDFSSLGTFDIIFCRNVLIYFDEKARSDIFQRVSQSVAADGYLVLGAAETIIGQSAVFQSHPQHRGIYQLSSKPAAFSLAV